MLLLKETVKVSITESEFLERCAEAHELSREYHCMPLMFSHSDFCFENAINDATDDLQDWEDVLNK